MSSFTRTRIVWIDGDGRDVDVTPFLERDLVLERYANPGEVKQSEQTKAIFYRLQPRKRGKLGEWLRQSVPSLLDHGVSIYLLADNDNESQFILNSVKTFQCRAALKILTAPGSAVVAEHIKRQLDLPIADADIRISGDPVNDRFKLYLSRSFYGCDSVVVRRLAGGRTAKVVSAHVRFRDSVVGPRPLPFFVKFAKRNIVDEELLKYRTYVDHYIPFHLRPHLDYGRCLIGPTHGILVGSFVDHSVSLLDFLQHGGGTQVIHNLFEESLGGWRVQAYEGPKSGIKHGPLSSELQWFSIPGSILPKRFELARSLGATKGPKELHDALMSWRAIDFRSAPMHADLHTDNVRVRGYDAIVIDFQRVRNGPIVVDPAFLEVSLMFTAGRDTNDGWRELANTLYLDGGFDNVPPPAREPNGREWLWNAVRQIRQIGRGCETSPREYRTALIHCLLRRARLHDKLRKDDERGAYAYVIAEKLILAGQ